ncbi:flagellar motor protein MotB [Desulfovibrio mangrovi]|uniref:OmpA/MotB family protein n=1 Tax=Desulfovibrio mangrovi TaxID=2976983 RepID=UPI0022484155|nr:flagellar motor protein MotB [Desulfovibrio mangrovi]UZP66232.1 flagellar motor protein MotB [Desulfovibrio mangrovi]
MARRKKKKGEGGGAAWLITFSDMMTLMLTFFVLLVSMAVIDERRKLTVLQSISGQFGEGLGSFNPASVKNQARIIEPGVMDFETDSLEPLKDMLWDDQRGDLNFQENQFVQIISISDEVLFQPGSAQLSAEGMRLIDRMLPWFLRIQHPLLLAGHTAGMREEMGEDYKAPTDNERQLSPAWEMSFLRVMSLYRYLTSRGLPPARLSVEGFGSYRPRWSENTPEGRKRNRRVDIVLDKRNKEWIDKIEVLREKARKKQGEFNYKDFRFRLGLPGEEKSGAGE